jgi:competence protein ComEA
METRTDGPRNLGEQIDEWLYRWDETRRRPVVMLGMVAAVGVVVVCAWWFAAGADEPAAVDDRIPQVSLVPTTVPALRPSRPLVHVAGAVRAPGVYELADGARVLDAIEAAGGATGEGQADRLNLAALVIDGMKIRVPVEGESVVEAGMAGSETGPVNVNTASADQLESLPGVGPATAAAILAYRTEHGRFGQVEDLLDVPGIGEAKLAVLEDLVVLQ